MEKMNKYSEYLYDRSLCLGASFYSSSSSSGSSGSGSSGGSGSGSSSSGNSGSGNSSGSGSSGTSGNNSTSASYAISFNGSVSNNGSYTTYVSTEYYTGENFSLSDISSTPANPGLYISIPSSNRGIEKVTVGESSLILCNDPETVGKTSVSTCWDLQLARLSTHNITKSGKKRLYAWHMRDEESGYSGNDAMTYRMDVVNKGCDLNVKFTPYSTVGDDTGNKWTDLKNWLDYACEASSSDMEWYKNNYPSYANDSCVNLNIEKGISCNLFVKKLYNGNTVGILGELEISATSSGFVNFDIVEYAYWGEKTESEIQTILSENSNLSVSDEHSRGVGNADIEVTSKVISVNNAPSSNVAKGIGLGALSLVTDAQLAAAWKNGIKISNDTSDIMYNEGLYGVKMKVYFNFRNDTGATASFDILAGSAGGPSHPTLKFESSSSVNGSLSGSYVEYSSVPAQKLDLISGSYVAIQGVSKMMTVSNVANGKQVQLQFDMFFPAGGSAEYIIAVLQSGVWDTLTQYSATNNQ